MRTLTGLTAISVLTLSITAAFAASGPSGKYAFVSSEMCEAQLTLVKDTTGRVIDVILGKSGMMSGGTGYITFTPTSASGGTATITGAILVEGGAVRVGTNAFNWVQQANNHAATPYSFTPTTLTFGGQVFQTADSNLISGVFKNVYLVRRDTAGGNSNCVNTISATKQ